MIFSTWLWPVELILFIRLLQLILGQTLKYLDEWTALAGNFIQGDTILEDRVQERALPVALMAQLLLCALQHADLRWIVVELPVVVLPRAGDDGLQVTELVAEPGVLGAFAGIASVMRPRAFTYGAFEQGQCRLSLV